MCYTTQVSGESMLSLFFSCCSDTGAHIDGFIAVAAHSVLIQSDSKAAVTGRQADVLQAAHTALEAAIRLIRPGKLVSEVLLLTAATAQTLKSTLTNLA